MNCPICNRSLDSDKYEYLPYHFCRRCQGMWVDAKLLKHLAVRLAVQLNVKPNKPVTFHPKPPVRIPKNEPIRLCPKCGAGMKKLNYAYDSDVIIDRCDACQGLWLDKGEIMQLAACHQVDEKSVLLARELLYLKQKPEEDKENAYIEIIIMAAIILAKLIFRF